MHVMLSISQTNKLREMCSTPLYDTSRSANSIASGKHDQKYTLESFSKYTGVSNVVEVVRKSANMLIICALVMIRCMVTIMACEVNRAITVGTGADSICQLVTRRCIPYNYIHQY